MPIRAYRVLTEDGTFTGEIVEVFQFMKAAMLDRLEDGRRCEIGVQRIKTKPHWCGKESVSMALEIDPSDLGEWQKDVPDLKINARGQAVYDNDQHQRKVYKQMLAAREKYEGPQRKRARLARERRGSKRTSGVQS